jgi:hypothetical protein
LKQRLRKEHVNHQTLDETTLTAQTHIKYFP